MPGKIYLDRLDLNGRILFTVTSSPNGVLPGNAGDLAIRKDAPNGTLYVNVDGALTWVDLSAMTAPSPWFRVGTTVELVIGTDRVGIGTIAPASKLHVASLATQVTPVLTLESLTGAWQDFVGAGSPEGIITASRGDTFHDDLGNLWLKVTGDATNTGWFQILTDADGWRQNGNSFGALGTLGTLDAFDLRFITNGAERARVLSATGQFLINAAVPAADETLRVNGDGRFDGNLIVTQDLIVQGTTVSVDSETVLIADNHLYLNNGYETPAPQTGGLVVNYLPIPVTDTVGAGGFTAGVLAISNPFVITTGAGTFAVGELIQISGTGTPDFPINDGLFEVLSHVGTTLTIRGVGTVGTVEDFTQNQFTTDPLTAGSITRVNVSVNRAGLDGKWEVGQGSVTPLVFTDLSTVGSDGWTDDGTVVRLTTVTDQVGIGTATPAAGVKVHVVEDGAARGIRSDVGAASDLALEARIAGDAFPRFDVNGNGYLFGGSGAAAVDVLLRRATVGVAAWEARDGADGVFINVRGADAVVDDDLVTRRQLTAAIGGTVLVFNSAAPANAGNVFNTWAALQAAATLIVAAGGTFTIWFESTCVLPVGASLVGQGFTGDPSYLHQVDVPEGVTFTIPVDNEMLIRGVYLLFHTTATRVASGELRFNLDDCTLENDQTFAPFEITGTPAEHLTELHGTARINLNNAEVFKLTGVTSMALDLYDLSQVEPDVIAGDAASTLTFDVIMVSVASGTPETSPQSTFAGTINYGTQIRVRNIRGPTVTQASSTLMTRDQNRFVVLVDTTAAVRTKTLPLASSCPDGQRYVFKKKTSSANKVLIAPTGADTIEGVGATFDLSTIGASLTALYAAEFVSDGVAGWWIDKSTSGGSAAGSSRWGNVCFVDKVFGDNATAARNGLPFLTITAALAAALAGDVVYVLPGTYTEAITIPASVSVVGLDKQRCILDRTAIGVATDIVTLGTGSGIASMTITGSTVAAVQLRGVVFPNVAGTARVRNCAIIVGHTGAGAAAGVEFTGGGTSPASDFSCLIDSSVLVSGSGAQNRFGVYISGGGSNPIIETTLVRVTRAGGAVGSYHGAEMNGTGVMTLREGSYEGPSGAGGADVSQASGTLALDNARLITANANGLGFTARSGCWTEWYGDTGVPTIAATRFFRSGTTTAQATEVTHTTRSDRVARAIVVTSRVAPGGGQNCVFTLRKNGVNTGITVTVSNAATTGTQETVSVGYVAGDNYSVQCVQSATSALADVQVGIEWYTG